MPAGCRLLHFEPKDAPLYIDQSSVVFNVAEFVARELAELNARINDPWTVRGGWTLFQIVDRLAQCGVCVEVCVSIFPPKEDKP